MPRSGKVKIQWIVQKSERQASFRKRRSTLFDKARDLSILCQVPAAVIVYGGGEAEPQVWPGVQEVTEILRRYRDLPDSLKEARSLDNERIMRRRTEKMRRKLDNCRASASRLEVNLILNDISLGRRREFADLPRELTGAVVSGLDALRSVTADRVNCLRAEEVDAVGAPAAAAGGSCGCGADGVARVTVTHGAASCYGAADGGERAARAAGTAAIRAGGAAAAAAAAADGATSCDGATGSWRAASAAGAGAGATGGATSCDGTSVR